MNNMRPLLPIICILFLSSATAQSIYEADSLVIKSVMDSIRTKLLQRKTDEAFVLLEQAGRLLDAYPDPNTPMFAYWYEYQGYGWNLKGQVAKAISFFEKSMTVYRKHYPSSDVRLTYPLNNLGSFYMKSHDFKRSREYLEEALNIRLRLMPEAFETGQSWSNLGGLEFELGNYVRAMECYDKAEATLKPYLYPQAQVSLSMILLNKGSVYDEWGDYDQAIDYYRKSLSIRKKWLVNNDIRIARCLSLLGKSYENKLDLPDAENCYREALHLCTALAPDVDSSELAICFEDIATLLFKQKKYLEAIQHQKHCINIREQCSWLGVGRVADAQVLLAQIYQSTGNLDSAACCARQAISIWERSYQKFFPPSRLEGWTTLADVRLQQGYLEEAWQLTEEAKRFNGKSSDADFTKEQRTLIIQARICHAHYRQSRQLPDLQAALPILQKILDSRATQQLRFGRSGSRLTAAELLYPVAEEALDICTELYKTTQDISIVDLAFNFMEQTKSVLLRMNANETQAIFSGQMPAELMDEESAYKYALTKVEAERTELLLSSTPLNDPAVLELDGSLFELNRKMDSLKTIIRQQYPAYFQARYSTATAALNNIQHDLLGKEQTLLSYFWGEQSIFVIGIQGQDVFLKRLSDSQTLDSAVRQVLQEIRTPRKESQAFISAARHLYDALMGSVAKRLTRELVVIPDGILSYVPFEVLLDRQPNNVYRYHTFPYVLLNHQISYAPSASIWQEMYRKAPSKEPTGILAAFAPFYEGNSDQLVFLPESDTMRRQIFDPLPYSGEEVHRIQKIIGGKVFFKKDATLSRFDSIASQYRILHLATHGKANDQSGDLSYLAFLKVGDITHCDLLLARDLYMMRLNADLVTLSACETGIGEMRRGEGIVSLARAFVFAGSKSIVTSLWTVNDACTEKLMVAFYGNLKKRMTKDEALAAAKRSYLKNFSPTAHPYYWASFVALGDMRPLWR